MHVVVICAVALIFLAAVVFVCVEDGRAERRARLRRQAELARLGE